ncbi:GNAT family N-acetyltransferase [Streptomyces sp. H39-S7]|uniref:GNAT family N-acetyltransferase n=1 Tax=Streptomyces sp. H39-S7 TaxID=3004357 RepID=UPI0022AEECCE|nr:GNAT family N-acetyltransferase [Streptomyces sp. H39-S7]MCZ4119818.1 GNAT family N-acetyltransferase [Streptomyces sp. H39-S7]
MLSFEGVEYEESPVWKSSAAVEPLAVDEVGAIDDFSLPYRQTLRWERPSDPPACPTAFLGQVQYPRPGNTSLAWGARVEGQPVGILSIGVGDGEEGADIVHFFVHPDFRRRGIGSALMASAAQLLQGRRVLSASALVIDPETGSSSGEAFAEATGAVCRTRYQRLTLRIEAGSIDSGRDHPGYETLRWRGGVPPEYLPAFAQLSSSLAAEEAARSDSKRAPEKTDGEKIDALYKSLQMWGYRTYVSAVRHVLTGELVAYSSLGLAESHHRHASQWDTIVRPSHRGHGLGASLKRANMSWAMEHEPELTTVTAWNAIGNDAMVHVNESVGFRHDTGGAVWEWNVSGLT